MMLGQSWNADHKHALVEAVAKMAEEIVKFNDDYIGCSILIDKDGDTGKHILAVRFERGDRSAAFSVDDTMHGDAVSSLMEALGSALETLDIDLGDDDAVTE